MDGLGVVEQIDGVIELQGDLYLVEMKWWQDALGPGDVAQHLVTAASLDMAPAFIALRNTVSTQVVRAAAGAKARS